MLVVLGAGCSVAVPGSAQPEQVVRTAVPVDGITDASGGAVDALVAAALTDISAFWSQTFPAIGDVDYADIGQVVSVDTAGDAQQEVPCVESAAEVQGNAFYCPAADAMVYDRAALMPTLAQRYGDTAVVLVLAHEVGHSVHTQLGLTPEVRRRDPDAYPTIVTESMADCRCLPALGDRW